MRRASNHLAPLRYDYPVGFGVTRRGDASKGAQSMRNCVCASILFALNSLRGGEGALAPCPKENSKQKSDIYNISGSILNSACLQPNIYQH